MAAAFGARRFGAALIVFLQSRTSIRADTQRAFVLLMSDLRMDYQSGAEPPHSKGSADLIYAHASR